MLRKTVKHKVTGEQITFVETAKDTNGAYLLIEVYLPPNGDGPPLHYHDEFVEQFTIINGMLTVTVGEQEHVLGAGDTITAPIGTAHTFNNRHDQPVTFRVRLTPPSQFEESVRIHYGLMEDGLTNSQGIPNNVFHLILILKLQNTLIAGKSLRLQRMLFNALIKIGKLFKMFNGLEKYTGEKIHL